jgi:FKBP-type peptidyl-prolyl cis-trans isomerase
LKRQNLVTLFAAGLIALAACTQLKTPQDKAGYAVGMSIGQRLEQVKAKLDLGQVAAGFNDGINGKGSLDDAAVMEQLRQLNPNAAATDKGKMGYAVGLRIGRDLSHIKDDATPARVMSGLKDSLAGKPKLKPEEMNAALKGLSEIQSAKNKGAGVAFLEENKKKPGVKVTASGLQYEVITLGKGKKPNPKSTVKVNYRGTLIDGKEFDSSYSRHAPAEFQVGGVIPGWTEALQLMPVGSKFRLVIPSALAYGERGTPGGIGPDSVLVFEVELLAISK